MVHTHVLEQPSLPSAKQIPRCLMNTEAQRTRLDIGSVGLWRRKGLYWVSLSGWLTVLPLILSYTTCSFCVCGFLHQGWIPTGEACTLLGEVEGFCVSPKKMST